MISLPRTNLRQRRLTVGLAGFAVLTLSLWLFSLSAVADEEFETIRGLLGEYQSGQGKVIQRLDPDIHFDWESAAPDPRIDPAGFSVTWTGTFLQREDAPLTFHAHLAGTLQVTLGEHVVLDAESAAAGWQSGPTVSIPPGVYPFRASYRRTGATARVGLYWSSSAFPLEPVSTYLFSADDLTQEPKQFERGRQLFAAHRCNRCHVRAIDSPSPPAPALWGVAEGLNPDWLTAKLQGLHSEVGSSWMPNFKLTQEEASDIAAFLTRLGSPHELSPVPDFKTPERKKGEPEPPTGRELLVSIGCLACHRVGELGQTGPFAGSDLSRIGEKRSPEWLSTWLSQPDKLNPQHRMPVFKLTPTERALLVHELSAKKSEQAKVSFEKLDARGAEGDRGRTLVKQLRCANCHKIPAIEIDTKGIPPLDRPVSDWNQSCLAEESDRTTGRPYFPQADREALRVYVEGQASPERFAVSTFDLGRTVLEWRNCLGCHERDGAQGIVAVAGRVAEKVEPLRGQSEALIPPSLTAVGDKATDTYLSTAISGEQRTSRLPWLKVRMPRFTHTPEEKAALVTYLTAHDRIPQTAPVMLSPHEVTVDDAVLLIGRQLVGAGGFSCIACHKMQDYEPRNVAFGTRGSDLMHLTERMRPDFFMRWTRSPLRIVPGMEMPSYLRPVHGVLNDDLNLQLSTLWGALGDPKFEPPTNPTQVEQFIVVRQGDRPHIVRDVFTDPNLEKTGAYAGIARAFACGFDNGHSVLFDLDRAELRGWTYGDFARQRTEGKSWYWDMAGTLLIGNSAALGQLVLRDSKSGQLVNLQWAPENPPVRPVSYQTRTLDESRQVHLHYKGIFSIAGVEHTVLVTEHWRATADHASSGWQREVQLSHVPTGFEPVITRVPAESARFDARLNRIAKSSSHEESSRAVPEQLEFVNNGDLWSIVMAYECSLPAYSPPVLGATVSNAPGWPPAMPVPVQNSLLGTPVTTLPGFAGRRLNVPISSMPTAMAFADERTLYFTSLKGHVYRVVDQDGDGIEDQVTEFEEGLAAPFGVLVDQEGILVAHKPELVRLIDQDGDGRADEREIIADGWGYTDNYHDWTTGPVRDAAGRMYLALGSDYSQPDRPEGTGRWRGTVLRVNSDGTVDPIAHELRFPQGIAFDPAGRLFVTDQQGHGNPFNELNEIVEGRYYGVPARFDEPRSGEATSATIKVPHPWTRSVNGLFFLPLDHPSPFGGHAIGCEYNGRFLVRYSQHIVQGELQGAVYPFSTPTWKSDAETFVGPICGTVAPNGDILVGSIHDSGWLGGLNVGEIVRLSPADSGIPNGIREVRAVAPQAGGNEPGLAIEFIHPVESQAGTNPRNYSVLGYTRVWQGAYATEDTGRYEPNISRIEISEDRRTVVLRSSEWKSDFVYEFRCSGLTSGSGDDFFPDFAAYTMNRIP